MKTRDSRTCNFTAFYLQINIFRSKSQILFQERIFYFYFLLNLYKQVNDCASFTIQFTIMKNNSLNNKIKRINFHETQSFYDCDRTKEDGQE